MDFTVEEIKDLMVTLSKNKLASVTIKKGDFSIMVEAPKAEYAAVISPPIQTGMAMQQMEYAPVQEQKAEAGSVMKSPIVGTFYAAPGPDKEPFVKTGQRVSKGDVLFIIESMKLMNEVTSEFDGEVTEILVENGGAVEYGQPIMRIE